MLCMRQPSNPCGYWLLPAYSTRIQSFFSVCFVCPYPHTEFLAAYRILRTLYAGKGPLLAVSFSKINRLWQQNLVVLLPDISSSSVHLFSIFSPSFFSSGNKGNRILAETLYSCIRRIRYIYAYTRMYLIYLFQQYIGDFVAFVANTTQSVDFIRFQLATNPFFALLPLLPLLPRARQQSFVWQQTLATEFSSFVAGYKLFVYRMHFQN